MGPAPVGSWLWQLHEDWPLIGAGPTTDIRERKRLLYGTAVCCEDQVILSDPRWLGKP
jgi:hypothetical protein